MVLDWNRADKWLIGESWVNSRIMEHLGVLCDDIGPRWATSSAEAKAAQYITDQMQRNGLTNVHLEEFDFDTWKPERSTLQVEGDSDSKLDCLPLLFSPPVRLSAPFVDVGFSTEHEIAGVREHLQGSIAVLDAGYEPFTKPIPLARRLEVLAAAGTGAAVVVNSVGGRFLSYMNGSDWIEGNISSALSLPSLLTSREDGARIRRLANSDTRLNINIDTAFFRAASVNTVSDIRGDRWPDEQIILCAHHDTVLNAPGANDDGSGVSVAMEVARVLSELRNGLGLQPGRTLRFVTFGAEEQMLQGSRAYVRNHFGDDDLPHFLLNLDELGTGPVKGIVLQFPELREFIQSQLDTMNDQLKCYVLEFIDKSGDGYPFARRGIPSGFIWRWRFVGKHPDATFGHSSSDTLDKIRIRDLKEYVGMIARLLLRLSHIPSDQWPTNTLSVQEIEGRLKEERDKVMRTA